MLKKILRSAFLATALLVAAAPVFAQNEPDAPPPQEEMDNSMTPPTSDMPDDEGMATKWPLRRSYISSGIDGAILSTASFERPGRSRDLTTARFSGFFHFGMNWNYNYDEHFGIQIGLGIKNIGFIDKNGDSTIKRRVYTIGVPVAFKLGNFRRGNFGFIGGGADVPFNYREKGFVDRGNKTKFNEFWSDRTPRVMPFMFIGYTFRKGATFKLQFYPSNFFNQDYVQNPDGESTMPYRGYDARLINLSYGLSVPYLKRGSGPMPRHRRGDAEMRSAPVETTPVEDEKEED